MKNSSILLLLTLTLAMEGCTNNHRENMPMNVILILTDDQGYGDLAFHGNPLIDTPELDQLAKESVEFTRFYVSPVCAPTRASLLTGRYHLRTGTSWVTHRKEVMRSEEVTLAEIFRDNGYETGLFGKWHNGKQYPHDPIGQGFDQFVGFKDGHLNNYFDPVLTFQFEESKTDGYINDIITDQAIASLKSQEKPFFSMISYNTPHSPFQVPDKYFDKYKARNMSNKDACIYGMVENIDENIGRIRNHLETTGQADNTLILFMTDNGPNGWRYNNGLKGRKAHVDEGGVRVPLLIHHPQKTEWGNKKISEMAAHIDVLPTLAELLQLEVPTSLNLDGVSLSPLLSGRNLENRHFFTHQISWNYDTVPGAVRSAEYVLTRKSGGDELYQLLNDSIQQRDLAEEMPELVEELTLEYQNWLEEVTSGGLTPPPIEVGHPHVPIVEFSAPDAFGIGNLQFKGGSGWANDWLTGWQAGSQVTWKAHAVETMTYEVYVELSSVKAINQGLSIRLGEKILKLVIDEPAIAIEVANHDRVERGEVNERIWPLVHVGTLRFADGDHELTLQASNLAINTQLEVKSIKLIPTSQKDKVL